MKTDVKCCCVLFCVVCESGYYFWGWHSEGELPFIVSCVIPLLTEAVTSLIMAVWLLAFLGAQQLCRITVSFLSLSLHVRVCAVPLYTSHSLAVMLFQLALKVLTEVTLPGSEAGPDSLTEFLVSWSSLPLPGPAQHRSFTVVKPASALSPNVPYVHTKWFCSFGELNFTLITPITPLTSKVHFRLVTGTFSSLSVDVLTSQMRGQSQWKLREVSCQVKLAVNNDILKFL